MYALHENMSYIYGTIRNSFHLLVQYLLHITSVPWVESRNGSPVLIDKLVEETRSVSEVGTSNRSDKKTSGFWSVQGLVILNRSAVF